MEENQQQEPLGNYETNEQKEAQVEPLEATKGKVPPAEDKEKEDLAAMLRKLLTGEILNKDAFRKEAKFIALVVLMVLCYISIRYQVQNTMISVRLEEKALKEVINKETSYNNELMEKTRPSKVMSFLRSTQDSTLTSDEPPIIIKREEGGE